LPPEHLTELQGALGTLEFVSGADRKARKDLRSSLEAPTENTVAQARWLSTKLPGIPISDDAFALPLSYEARCWRALQESRWQDARLECLNWLYDEPFSGQPAQVGSYIGLSVTSDSEFAEASAKAGLTADPTDASLLNNLAVALAYQGRTLEAITEFRKITPPLPTGFPAYVYLATTGLLRFRGGDIDGGRKMYEKAERWAPSNRRGRVAIFRAREELHAESGEALNHVERARQMNAKAKDDDAKRLLELLEKQATEMRIREAVQTAQDVESVRHELAPLIATSGQVLPDGNLAEDLSSHPQPPRTATMASKKKSHTGHRSSVTGRFVKEGYAKRYPHRTQTESIPNPGHGDTGRGKKGK
jgi:tetratricopeptide (TPR) repeat protein